ncbi:hypothetical protein QBC42DRAFT_325811 [Cladorrhinum samala]|uniref:Chitin-binding type-4 domain-containing protein n=1 Tax=Cladorrhinum samala TaxID=585594 RepID=A0AAV9HS28_9PEZI|nr:hypothetical protein QBC42DRAFT_325811 [Cladorrhinum samala]
MHLSTFLPAVLGALVSVTSAHGVVRKPAYTRQPGAATAAACGQNLVTFYKQDETSYPEAFLRSYPRPTDAQKCNLWLCKGYQFADNAANVQSYKAGDVIDLEVFIRIPHKGYANVSVVDTTTNKVVGTPLISWADNYAASLNPPANQVKFSVKVPTGLEEKCATAGTCVLQWHWFGQGQTYQSCIDFTVPAAAAAPVVDAGHEHARRGIRGQTYY